MLKWVWRILYFVIIAILSLQVYGYAYFEQLGAYYEDHIESELNNPNAFMEGMNTILGLSYFQETPNLYEEEISDDDTQFTITIKAVGAVTDGDGVDGYAIIFSDLFFSKDNKPLDRTVIKITVELDNDTFIVDGERTNRKTLIYDSGNPFSFQNVPVFFVFDYDGYTLNTETNTYASLSRIEMTYGWVEADTYVYDDTLTYLGTPESNNEAAMYKSSDITFTQEDYTLIDSFSDFIPSETDIETYQLNINRGNLSAYDGVVYRIIALFLTVVFIVTYFLFFHKSVLAFIRKKKARQIDSNTKSQAIFKDPPNES